MSSTGGLLLLGKINKRITSLKHTMFYLYCNDTGVKHTSYNKNVAAATDNVVKGRQNRNKPKIKQRNNAVLGYCRKETVVKTNYIGKFGAKANECASWTYPSKFIN